jgi:hypothetical protein
LQIQKFHLCGNNKYCYWELIASDKVSEVKRNPGKTKVKDARYSVRNMIRQAQDIGLRYERPKKCNESTNITYLLTRLDKVEHGLYKEHTTPFESVKTLLERKTAITKGIHSGKLVLKKGMEKDLGPLFTQGEMASLFDYSENRRASAERRKEFYAVMSKISHGSISAKDISRIKELVDDTTAAKFTILYNDRMADGGKHRNMLKEDKGTRTLRKYISNLRAEHSKLEGLLPFLDGLSHNKFPNSAKFVSAVNGFGPHASAWLNRLGYADRLHLVQYAVGENELIENPIHNRLQPKYLYENVKDWPNWDRMGSGRYYRGIIEDDIRYMLSTIRNSNIFIATEKLNENIKQSRSGHKKE